MTAATATQPVYQMRDNAGDWVDIEDAVKLQALAQQAFRVFGERYQSVQDVIENIPSGRVYYDTEWYASLRIKPMARTMACKPQAPKEQTMVTSTGQSVDADEWDKIEGA